MRRHIVTVVALVLALPSCAHVEIEVTYPEQLVSSAVEQQAPRDRKLVAVASTSAAGIHVIVNEQAVCVQQSVDTFRKFEHVERTVDKRAVSLEYVLGLLGLGAGVVLIAIAPSLPEQPSSADPNELTQSKAYGTGGALALVGAAGLAAAVSDTLAARDSHELVDEYEVRPAESRESSACEHEPAAVRVELVMTSEIATQRVVLGATDRSGQLSVDWMAVPEQWVRGDGGRNEARVVADGTAESAAISLARARSVWAEQAWDRARDAGTSAALAAYRSDYADYHADEADAAWQRARIAELGVAIEAAFEAGDGARASRYINELAVLDAAHSELAEYRDRAAALVRSDLRASLGESTAAPFHSAAAVDDARAAVDELAALGELAKTVASYRAAVERRAAALLASLLKRANKALAAGDYKSARELVDEAEMIAPASAAVATLRASVVAAETGH